MNNGVNKSATSSTLKNSDSGYLMDENSSSNDHSLNSFIDSLRIRSTTDKSKRLNYTVCFGV